MARTVYVEIAREAMLGNILMAAGVTLFALSFGVAVGKTEITTDVGLDGSTKESASVPGFWVGAMVVGLLLVIVGLMV